MPDQVPGMSKKDSVLLSQLIEKFQNTVSKQSINQMLFSNQLSNQFSNQFQVENSNTILSQILTQSHQTNKRMKDIDMAYLFADPLFSRGADKNIKAYNYVALDLQTEYNQLVSCLKKTRKQMHLIKEAITMESLQEVILMNPKIIHISCHGDYQQMKNDKKEFYLSIEGENGEEQKLFVQQLKELLGIQNDSMPRHNIQVAIVSACHSEQIGNVLLEAGIPVVISVNADQGIMDEAAKIFMKTFYRNLLNGHSISASFEAARRQVQMSSKNMSVCCCAHPHTDDCAWFKFFQQDPVKAHEIHMQHDCCPTYGINGVREHLPNCKTLIEFKYFMS